MSEAAKPDVTLTYPREFVRSPEPPPGVALDESVAVTMRDGIRLAVDVYRPLAAGRYPALLSVSPYSKDIQQKPPHWSHAIESGATGFYVPKGYVHVIAQAARDCRKANGIFSTNASSTTATIWSNGSPRSRGATAMWG